MTRTTKAPTNVPGSPEPSAEIVPVPDIGRSIRMFRASEGLTQADLEKMTGVNRASLSAYETGRRRPRPATVARIMAVVESPTADGS
ncbi:MAG TPA: helix-turn-helix transcriptional regulator [Thermoanaerobaculia bacterium]|nr:helix-turn-helix transcriptional regulator [Thermoanaerobaculia bacterium]